MNFIRWFLAQQDPRSLGTLPQSPSSCSKPAAVFHPRLSSNHRWGSLGWNWTLGLENWLLCPIPKSIKLEPIWKLTCSTWPLCRLQCRGWQVGRWHLGSEVPPGGRAQLFNVLVTYCTLFLIDKYTIPLRSTILQKQRCRKMCHQTLTQFFDNT